MECKQHATLNPQYENSNRDMRIRLVRRHVSEPDEERVAHGLPYFYFGNSQGEVEG